MLEKENHERDAAFSRTMHGQSALSRGGLFALFRKNSEAQKIAVDGYFKHWGSKTAMEETESTRAQRRAEYATLTRHYYDLVTDFYEYGWGQSFHFCRFSIGEPFRQAIARHEHFLAHMMDIREDALVLDVGCGIGGPAREIAKFSGASVVGLNNNDYQIDRAVYYTQNEGLSDKLNFMKGDFMQMPFEDNMFDAVYAIEATVHAPALHSIYSEIFRVLKPGGVFGVYEWLMTDKYDNDDPSHRQIRLRIEEGNGISNMERVTVALESMEKAGFEMIHNEDLAKRPCSIPWYYPLAGDFSMMQSIWDFPIILRMTKMCRGLVHRFIGAMEALSLAPVGSRDAGESMARGGDALVVGGREDLFTPMYFMMGRKRLANQ